MLEVVARHWWVPVVRGVISILFGIAAFRVPGWTIVFFIAFMGAYLFVDGIFALIQAIRFRHEGERWPSLLLEGILGIGIGVVTYFRPGIAVLAWLYTIAAWAVITGILEIIAAVRMRKMIADEFLLALTGVVSIALGIAFVARPLAGLVAWIWLMGAYAVVFGVLLIGLGLRLRNAGLTGAASAPR